MLYQHEYFIRLVLSQSRNFDDLVVDMILLLRGKRQLWLTTNDSVLSRPYKIYFFATSNSVKYVTRLEKGTLISPTRNKILSSDQEAMFRVRSSLALQAESGLTDWINFLFVMDSGCLTLNRWRYISRNCNVSVCTSLIRRSYFRFTRIHKYKHN